MDNVSVREYIERVLQQQHEIIDSKIQALNREIDKAASVLSQRLDNLNRLREEVNEDRLVYVRKTELDLLLANIMTMLKSHAEDLREIQETKANFTGRLWMMGALITLFSAVITIAISIWSHK